jgi:hypothetical protein
MGDTDDGDDDRSERDDENELPPDYLWHSVAAAEPEAIDGPTGDAENEDDTQDERHRLKNAMEQELPTPAIAKAIRPSEVGHTLAD